MLSVLALAVFTASLLSSHWWLTRKRPIVAVLLALCLGVAGSFAASYVFDALSIEETSKLVASIVAFEVPAIDALLGAWLFRRNRIAAASLFIVGLICVAYFVPLVLVATCGISGDCL